MANLFEKPIAANPMSEFVALPMDFIERSLNNRQARFDAAKADIEAEETSLLGLKFLPGDRERHMELQGGLESELDAIVDAADGDYSMVQSSLDRWKRKARQEITHGELGAQQRNYTSAMADHEVLRKRQLEGKTKDVGMAMFNKSMQEHTTTPTDSGGYSSFNGYNPSSVLDPFGELNKTAQDVVADSNARGEKGRSRDRILSAVYTRLKTDPQVEKALKEEYAGTDQKMSYTEYRAQVVEGVVSAKEYQDKSKPSTSNGEFASFTEVGVQRSQRSKGTNTSQGYAMINAKKFIGADNEAKEFANSKEGKRLIEALEYRTGRKAPVGNTVAMSRYIEEAFAENKLEDVPIDGTTAPKHSNLVDSKGNLTQRAAHIEDDSGAVIRPEDIEGDEKYPPVVIGTVGAGERFGQVVLATNKGTVYVENTSDEFLRSTPYQLNQLDMIRQSVSLEGEVSLKGIPKVLPSGNYTVRYNPKNKETELYQGDTHLYSYYLNDNKKPVISPTKR